MQDFSKEQTNKLQSLFIKCRICGNKEDHPLFQVKEMMFGLRESFDYFQCRECQCLQIKEIPETMNRYYGEGYYSFAPSERAKWVQRLRTALIRYRNEVAIFGKGSLLGKILYYFLPDPILKSLNHLQIKKDWRILDVGCGYGAHLRFLRGIGFSHLLGVDPYLAETINYDSGLVIKKCELEAVGGEWDLIMLNHSLEHIDDQQRVLKVLSKILAPEGVMMVRIPIVSSFAWEKYGVHWVQIDAPRHFYLHSLKSFEFVARSAGLRIDEVVFDSLDFQFWGSEQYLRDIPLRDPRSYRNCRPWETGIFSRAEIKKFRSLAAKLNKEGRGDQAVFYLRRDD